MASIERILTLSKEIFRIRGLPSGELDAELLLSHVLACKRYELHINKHKQVKTCDRQRFFSMVRRRAAREPLQYIIGHVEFYGLTIVVNPQVLIPRHETEEFVDIIITREKHRNLQCILDLGTGSGVIAIALAKHFPNAHIAAIDVSHQAIQLATMNAHNNGVRNIDFMISNWFDNVIGKFDLIVANPPYLSDEEFQASDEEVRLFEPQGALVAQNDGLNDIFTIIANAKNFLTSSGRLAIETGYQQHEKIHKFSQKFFQRCVSVPDLSHRDRFVFLS